jgi:large subunit ribosomal protein L35
MGYKFKPSKSIAKRFRVTATGKLKRRHTLSTHLRSARDAKKKRHLGRPAILFEGIARNLRRAMGVAKKRPAKIAHERALKAKAKKKESAAAK